MHPTSGTLSFKKLTYLTYIYTALLYAPALSPNSLSSSPPSSFWLQSPPVPTNKCRLWPGPISPYLSLRSKCLYTLVLFSPTPSIHHVQHNLKADKLKLLCMLGNDRGKAPYYHAHCSILHKVYTLCALKYCSRSLMYYSWMHPLSHENISSHLSFG